MKNTTKIATSLLLSALILGVTSPTFAATTTDGLINFKEFESPTKPVDPTDPNESIKPEELEDNKETGESGPLSLDVVPSKFDFGTHEAKMTRQVYQSESKGTSKENVPGLQYLQVTDNRTGASGWSLKVGMTAFSEITAGGELVADGAKLVGAILAIPKGQVRNQLHLPSNAEATDLKAAAVNLIAGESYAIFGTNSDAAGIGKATSTSYFKANDVQLTVPSLQAKTETKYKSTINWTLSAGANF